MAPILSAAIVLIAVVSFFALAGSQGEKTHSAVQTGEASRQPLLENQLRDLLTPVGVAVSPGFQTSEEQNVREATIAWETSPASKTAVSTEQADGKFTVSNVQVRRASLPRRRAVELAETEIFVAAVDETNRLVWWHIMGDPRVLRSEAVAASGEVSGRILYLPNVDFSISFPDDPAIKEVRLYHPQWNGERFQLIQIGLVTVR
jgi:hypothetical protein